MRILKGDKLGSKLASLTCTPIPSSDTQLYALFDVNAELLWVHEGTGYLFRAPDEHKEDAEAENRLAAYWCQIFFFFVRPFAERSVVRAFLHESSADGAICDLWACGSFFGTQEQPYRRLRVCLQLAATSTKGADAVAAVSFELLDPPSPWRSALKVGSRDFLLLEDVVLEIREPGQMWARTLSKEGAISPVCEPVLYDRGAIPLIKGGSWLVTAQLHPRRDSEGCLVQTRIVIRDRLSVGARLLVCLYDRALNAITVESMLVPPEPSATCLLYPQGLLSTQHNDIIFIPRITGANITFNSHPAACSRFARLKLVPSGHAVVSRVSALLDTDVLEVVAPTCGYSDATHRLFPGYMRRLVRLLLILWRVRRPGSKLCDLALPAWTFRLILWFVLSGQLGVTCVYGRDVF